MNDKMSGLQTRPLKMTLLRLGVIFTIVWLAVKPELLHKVKHQTIDQTLSCECNFVSLSRIEVAQHTGKHILPQLARPGPPKKGGVNVNQAYRSHIKDENTGPIHLGEVMAWMEMAMNRGWMNFLLRGHHSFRE